MATNAAADVAEAAADAAAAPPFNAGAARLAAQPGSNI